MKMFRLMCAGTLNYLAITSLQQLKIFIARLQLRKDENNQTQISTINTFLDGKKPD